ncbi:MAG: molybdenum cofactor biosynthesis protein [Anaerolineales bacterium]
MKKVTIKFFANLREISGIVETTISLPDDSKVSDLKYYLKDKFPKIAPNLDTTLVSINREFAFGEDNIPDGAEIALFPPVSGGGYNNPTVLIVTEKIIDLNELLEQITLPTTGAACFFTGMVRAKTLDDNIQNTEFLEYEAYLPMAEAKIRQVAEEIRTQWPKVEGIAIVQRIGRLDAGTLTVTIACSAAHRDSGVFEAARYGIDRLKEIVPIWKKEIRPSSESWIEGEYIPKRSDKTGLR